VSADPVRVPRAEERRASGYHEGEVDVVLSVDDVAREAESLRAEIPEERLRGLAKGEPFLSVRNLRAGYGNMEILHGFTMHVARGQSVCLIGPNGAGKSTVLHSIFGFARIFDGEVLIGGRGMTHDVTRLTPERKLRDARVAYILQDKSVFPDMTVEENLLMGGFLLRSRAKAKEAADRVFARYDRLAARRHHPARVLSGGERRLLEISRALVMEPHVLLVDEPSIGLEPRYIDMVFEILHRLQHEEGKTLVMVEQNARKGLEFADVGYVLVSGQAALVGTGKELLDNPDVGRLFLGG
jgi:branched-chain amino acid transport system ATP-binding protein